MSRGVYKKTEEHRKHLSKAKKGIKLSEKHKKKLRVPHIGSGIYERTKEHNRNVSRALKGNSNGFQKGHKINMGRKNALGCNRREKNYNWKGGKSFEPYPLDWTETLRRVIRTRDNHICQLCGIHQEELKGYFKKLDIHHIDYDKDNLDPKNLISLCRSCHQKTNYNREYWTNFFGINKFNN